MKSNRGFTIVELLVVIAIIGLLVSLLIPAIQTMREAARRSSCANNMRQISLAMLTYHDALKSFPPGNLVREDLFETYNCHPIPKVENEMIYCGSIGWPVFLLPYLEQSALYDRVDFDALAYLPDGCENTGHKSSHGGNENAFVAQNMPSIFSCSSTTPRTFTATHKDYGVNGRHSVPEREILKKDALFHANSETRLSDIARGASNTFLMLEAAHFWWWAPHKDDESVVQQMTLGVNPFFWVSHATEGYVCEGGRNPHTKQDVQYNINMKDCWGPTRVARSYHPKGINVAMCDGSVSFVQENIGRPIYWGLFQIRGDSLAKLP